MTATVRLPLGPLLARCGVPAILLAEVVGVSRTSVVRAARAGLTPVRADEWAVAAGFHPGEVWGDAWYELPDGAALVFRWEELDDELVA